MKLSQQWLQDFLKNNLNIKTISNTLTLAGIEVIVVKPIAPKLHQVVIGQINAISSHPNNNKLKICKVNIGKDTFLKIICSVNNIYNGMKIPVALAGAILPDNFKIRETKICGKTSYGMMCSEKELGLSETAEGLMELPKDVILGQCIREYLFLDDNKIEIDLTPNRADCLSVYGIAREITTLTNNKLKINLDIKDSSIKNNKIKNIDIEDNVACPLYFSRIITDVNAKVVTPIWMKERLRRSDIQVTSMVIINIISYVLLAFGQPINAFDADKLGEKIYVRYAKNGEKVILLNGKEIELNTNTLVIADSNKILEIAGIMGSLESSVTSETTNIFLESAYFSPESIQGKARQYSLNTESSYRYERGVDPALAKKIVEYATQLILEIAGGKAGKITGITQVMPSIPAIQLNLTRLNRLLGSTFEAKLVQNILKRLHLIIKSYDPKGFWKIIPPSYRFDIRIEADIIREVARIHGFENLPLTLPKIPLHRPNIKGSRLNISRLKTLMIDRGYHEVINYSFISYEFHNFFSINPGISIKNPISQEMVIMRQSLITRLLLNYKDNFNHQVSRIRLFEQGRCFFPAKKDNKYQEIEYLGGIAGGSLLPIDSRNANIVDFYAVKSDVEALLSYYNKNFIFKVCNQFTWLHPGKSAGIYQKNTLVGIIGVLHPNVIQLLHIKSYSPVFFELYCDKIISQSSQRYYKKITRFPSVSRDIAFIVDEHTPVQSIINALKNANISFLKDINIFDVYSDNNTMPKNKKSVTVRLIFQNNLKTLNEFEISRAVNKVLEVAKKSISAILRE